MKQFFHPLAMVRLKVSYFRVQVPVLSGEEKNKVTLTRVGKERECFLFLITRASVQGDGGP